MCFTAVPIFDIENLSNGKPVAFRTSRQTYLSYKIEEKPTAQEPKFPEKTVNVTETKEQPAQNGAKPTAQTVNVTDTDDKSAQTVAKPTAQTVAVTETKEQSAPNFVLSFSESATEKNCIFVLYEGLHACDRLRSHVFRSAKSRNTSARC